MYTVFTFVPTNIKTRRKLLIAFGGGKGSAAMPAASKHKIKYFVIRSFTRLANRPRLLGKDKECIMGSARFWLIYETFYYVLKETSRQLMKCIFTVTSMQNARIIRCLAWVNCKRRNHLQNCERTFQNFEKEEREGNSSRQLSANFSTMQKCKALEARATLREASVRSFVIYIMLLNG